MPFLTNISEPINYIITIYPFADPSRVSPVLISNILPNSFSLSYRLEYFSFRNDIFDPLQEGSARISQLNYDNIDFFKNVKEGDILFISENNSNIFSGYVESLGIDISPEGTNITINFCNLLKQISKAKIFVDILNTLQVAKDFRFVEFLDLISQSTIINKSIQISGNKSFLFMQGIGESPSTVLDGNNVIYVTISAYMSILQAINKIIYPYQRLIYQDDTGTIVFAPLSLFNDFNWQFEQRNNSDNNFLDNSFPYTDISVKKNAAGSYNQGYGTLFNIPIALSEPSMGQFLQNGFAAKFSPSPTYFARLNQLFQSGNFTMTDTTIEDVISDPNKLDQTLINISQLLQGSNISSAIGNTISTINQTPASQRPLISKDGKVDVSSILFNYVSRTLAESLTQETQVYIASPRVSQTDISGNLLPIPINKIVNLTMDNGILEQSAMFCRGYQLSYSSGGTMLTLSLCKPLSGTSFWVNGDLISVN